MDDMDLSHWWVTDPLRGQRVMSAELLTEAEARAIDHTAQRVYGTAQWRITAEGAVHRRASFKSGAALDTSR